MNFKEFTYVKEQVIHNDWIEYFWYLVNSKRREGVHFHGIKYEKPSEFYDVNRFLFSVHGIESHRKNPSYEGAMPYEGYCWVTHGTCYPDGSTINAKESLEHINPDGSNDSEIWMVLHKFYNDWIDRENLT